MSDAGLALGISSIIGSLWWVIVMLLYIPNTTYLRSLSGVEQEPIAWMWGNINNA